MSQNSDFLSPNQKEIEAALDAFLNARTWQDGIEVVRAREMLLLSDAAFEELRERIRCSQSSQGDTAQATKSLQIHLRFLEDSAKWGVARAWREHLARENRLVGMMMENVDEKLLSLLDIAVDSSFQKHASKLPPDLLHSVFSNSDMPLGGEVVPLLVEELELGGTIEAAMSMAKEINSLSEDLHLSLRSGTRRARLAENVPSLRRRLEQSREQHLSQTWTALLKIMLIDALCASLLNEQNVAGQRDQKEDFDKQNIASRKDLEEASTLYAEVREALGEKHVPLLLATLQWTLGYTRYRLLAGGWASKKNLVQAIGLLEQASTTFSTERQTVGFVNAQEALGNLRVEQFRAAPNRDHFERALSHYMAILRIPTQDLSPADRPRTLYNLGSLYLTYRDLPHEPDQVRYLKEAITCYDQALTFYTRETLILHRDIQINKSLALETLGRFQEAHLCLSAARDVMRDLFAQGMMEQQRARFIAEQARFNMYLRDAAMLLRHPSPDLKQVLIALEDGRAQAQRAALMLDSLILEVARLAQTNNPRARILYEEFKNTLEKWKVAQVAMEVSLPSGKEGAIKHKERQRLLEEAYQAFTRACDKLRAYDARFTDLLPQKPTFESISRAVKDEHEALVYLAACLDDGLALIVTRNKAGQAEIQHLRLPQLTLENVLALFLDVEELSAEDLLPERSRLAGGYFLAQANQGYAHLREWGSTFSDALKHLPPQSGLALAIKQCKEEWERQFPELLYLFDMPFEQDHRQQNSEDAFLISRFIGIFNQTFLGVELKRSLGALGSLGLNAVAQTLQKRKIHRIAIVPYGYLGNFPLPAVEITTGTETSSTPREVFGTLFEVNIAPSAHAFAVARERAAIARGGRGILTVGNPYPLSPNEGFVKLPFAEAEAENIRLIAETFEQGPIYCLTGPQAYKAEVKEKIAKSWLVHLSSHGQYRPEAPWKSRFLLAVNEQDSSGDVPSITVEECLKGLIDLKLVRLLMLSACETSVIDVRQAADEMIGLATSFFQAGAAGVIASSWPVSDRATCLLITRFMELYLNPQHSGWSPAYCLAQAQRWLRQEATYEVLATYHPVFSGEKYGDLESQAFSAVQRTVLQRLRAENALLAQKDPQGLPYAPPKYWAAFTLIGY